MPPSTSRHHRGPGSHHGQQQQQQPAGPPQGAAAAGPSPAVVSLQREISIALDASEPLAARCSSLGKLHTVMASHQAHRPAVAVAMLPLFLSSWPHLMACLWDPTTPQLAAAAAPLLGIVGALVTSSRAAAAAAAAAATQPTNPAASSPGSAAAAGSGAASAALGPPPPPASLLFDWLLPLLTGAVPLPTGAPAPPQLQALLCKTLAYALQQLPSCTAVPAEPQTTTRPQPQNPADAHALPKDASAAVPAADAPSSSQESQPAPSSAAAGAGAAAASATAGQSVSGTPSSSKGKLLTAPVPPVAAEQLQQHASAVMRAVQQLLEAVSTPPQLLGPLLQLLLEVLRLAHTAVTGAVLKDLLDLLLGWSLEPGLQHKDRQLIHCVLVALRPNWLSEPQLALEVGHRLLTDLKHLLSTALPQPAAAAAGPNVPPSAATKQPVSAAGDAPELQTGQQADPARSAAAAAGTAAGTEELVESPSQQQPELEQGHMQLQSQQQQQEQVQRLLALLSCLVAILKATGGIRGQADLAAGAVDCVETAHTRMAALAAAAASSTACDTTWTSAAASLAASMLALWETVVQDASHQQEEEEEEDSSRANGSVAAESSSNNISSGAEGGVADAAPELTDSSNGQEAALASAAAPDVPIAASPTVPGVAADTAAASGAPVSVGSGVTRRAWALVLHTLQLPLLLADDAVGLLGGISRALTWATAVYRSDSTRVCVGGQAQQQQQQQQQQFLVGPELVPAGLPCELWAATKDCRSSPLADVQAAAAAAYSAAILLAEALTEQDSVHGTSQTAADSAVGAAATATEAADIAGQTRSSSVAINPVLEAVLVEVAELCCQLAQSSSSGSACNSPKNASSRAAATAAAAAAASSTGLVDEAAGHAAQQQDASGRQSRQQLVSRLLFDLVLLEGWLGCSSAEGAAGERAAAPQPSAAAAAASAAGPAAGALEQGQPTIVTAAVEIAACVAAGVGQVAAVLLSGMQQLLQQQQQQQPEQGRLRAVLDGAAVDDDLLEQLLAVLQALLMASLGSVAKAATQHTTAAAAAEGALSCVQLLLSSPFIAVQHQVAAVQLLEQALMQTRPVQQCEAVRGAQQARGSTAAAADNTQPPSFTHAALLALLAAAVSASADVRAAATEAASSVAAGVLGSTQQEAADLPGDVELFAVLLQLLASRCSDADAAIAAAAQAAVTGCSLPLYLLSITSSSNYTGSAGRSSNGSLVGIVEGSSKGAGGGAAAAAAGVGVQWRRLAALQPQQRAFKPSQLAQLFDLAFHASPAMLQRSLQRPAQQQQQQPHDRWAMQAAALARLAQALPLLPQPAAGSSSSGSNVVRFEDISSAAVTSWLLIQESARQCVSARMRTHLGNPTQSFAALERILQALLQQLQTDGSPGAAQRTWQRQLLSQLQAAIPQQQQQQPQQQGASVQQSEPQQLLQAPGAAAAAATAAAAVPAAQRRSVRDPQQQQRQQPGVSEGPSSAGTAGLGVSAAAAEEARVETEAAVGGLLDFMYALEVNIQAATEGSIMRPHVGKSVMAFFAGNKKVCEDWFSRTRDSLLCLSAAAGTQQHVLFQGMARLQELHTQLKALTGHLQAQQQQLQAERERHKARQQEGSATAAAAAAAAAVAISGLGPQQQQEQQQRQQRGKQGWQQHSAASRAADGGTPEPRRLKGRQAAAATATGGAGATATAAADTEPSAGATQAAAGGAAVAEQLRLLQQRYQASLLQLVAPVLATLVLLADACVAVSEPHVVLGLQQWVHQGFHSVWQSVSQLYAWDLLSAEQLDAGDDEFDEDMLQLGTGAATAAGDGGAGASSKQQQQQRQNAAAGPSMLLLSWLPAAAAQAAGRYEEALTLYRSFLASEVCNTSVGSALRPWIYDQIAACYAAVADWQGLAQLCTAQQGPSGLTQQQQQQHQQQQSDLQVLPGAPWAQHWCLAGAAGVQALQAWALPQAGEQQRLGLLAVEQHLDRHRGAGPRAGRGRSLQGAVTSPHNLLHAVCLDVQQEGLPNSVSLAGVAMLNAVSALQHCSDRSSGIGADAEQQQQAGLIAGPTSPRGSRGGRRAGRGRVGQRAHGQQQHLQVADALGAAGSEQKHQVLVHVFEQIQQVLRRLEADPFVVNAAALWGIGGSSKSSPGASGGLQQLALMQLLQGQLLEQLQAHSVAATPQEDLSVQSSSQLLYVLRHLSHARNGSSSSSQVTALDGSSVWSAAFRPDGRLVSSLFGDVRPAVALLQCVAATAANSSSSSSMGNGAHARQLLLREALLACCSSGCSSSMRRLLQTAEAEAAGTTTQVGDALWLRLLGSKLQQATAHGQQPAVRAVQAHWEVLQQPLLQLQGHGSGSVPGFMGSSTSGITAACLSFGATLQQAADCSGAGGLLVACPDLQQVDWHSIHSNSLQQLPVQLQCCHLLPSAVADMHHRQQLAALACSAAATTLTPQHPAPWKAYGDLLFELATSTAHPASDSADPRGEPTSPRHQQQQQQQVEVLFGAAAEAYCMHLAALANTGALTSPQQGLGVLLKLLQLIQQHGPALQQELSAALGHCPAAAWQVLTNQLLAQLQHSSTAVRGLVQELLQGLAAVVPCAVLYPLVVEVRSAQEAGQEVSPELSAVVSQLQRVQPGMMSSTLAMADALEALTVTRWEAWAGLLMELSLETNRKLLSLRADVSRQEQQHLPAERRMEVFMNRYNTVMTPVISSLEQHIAAATASEPVSQDDASFRQRMLPQLSELLEALKQPPEELQKLAAGEADSDSDSEDAADADDAVNGAQKQQSSSIKPPSARAAGAGQPRQLVDSGGWPLLKQLRQKLQQHLRRQQHLQLTDVAPQLSRLRDTAIPLPADDMTSDTLPPLPLKSALDRGNCTTQQQHQQQQGTLRSDTSAGALLTDSRQAAAACPEAGAAVASAASAAGMADSGSWLCITAFDKQVAVLPTKTRPKRLLMLASDGSVHAFLLKGRDDLRVDERLMQFMRASNTLLAASSTTQQLPAAANSPASPVSTVPASAAAAAVAGWAGGQRMVLRMRPYSITPFGRRAGLVQWVRHTTSLFGLFRSWQQAAAERYQAVAAAKRDAAAAANAAAAAAGAGSAAQADRQAAAAAASGTAAGVAPEKAGEANGGSSTVPLPLIVAASRPTDAFYARLLPALQAAGLPVGSARSSWPASVLRSTFASLVREAPRALLARQLLSGAAGPGAWWSCQQAFTASAAAGSIVGWLLGLGDRHMDNLLLDRDSCELVHIDFSVCFDKGAGLAVPEVVPFRLTQMMQGALGPGGLSGPFSAAAAAMLSTLRASSDVLVSLLQLLLSDSAVDWSVDREAHAARKDQDTAVGLRLCASRLEELRHPLLASLAAALPSIGNGLAAIVSYGEAHVFMLQLQSAVTAAHTRATAASQTISEAAADEVRALTSGATAAKNVTSLTSDYRRLCGLAASCISSAGSWLSRHVETLLALGASGSRDSAGSGSALQSLLDVTGSSWDAALADRPLLLLTSNAAAATDQDSSSRTGGVLLQALGSFLPGVGGAGSADGGSAAALQLQSLLPPELLQHCLQLDIQGGQLLMHQQELVAQGRWSLACYAAVLKQLLSGGEAYIRSSHHWAWSTAFQAAAAGPEPQHIHTATATAPQLPSHDQVVSTWACLAAVWSTAHTLQRQHAAATAATATAGTEVSAMATSAAAGASSQDNEATGGVDDSCGAQQLGVTLRALADKMRNSSAESDAAEVQYVASKALAAACTAAQSAAATAACDCHSKTHDGIHTHQPADQPSSAAAVPANAVSAVTADPSRVVPEAINALQLQLAALQTAMAEYEQSGLSFILDPSTSRLSDELPEAAVSLEELLDAGETEAAAAVLAGQQGTHQQQWQQQLLAVSTQLQLLPQLLVAVQYEALAPVAAWRAAAQGVDAPASMPATVSSSPSPSAELPTQQQQVVLPAGPVSQQQLWSAAASHIQQHWQQLQQLLSQAVELEGHMHALAAVAAAGGAAAIWPEDYDLMSQAVALQQMLLPQGYDVLTTDECVASAQLLHAQWTELEQMLWVALADALCPLLGLQGSQYSSMGSTAAAAGAAGQEPGSGVAVLRQLLDAAGAGVAGGSLMHCKDVLEALAAGPTGSISSGSGSSSVWGVPGLCDAWWGLVVLLLQYGCLQQQLLQQCRAMQDDAAAEAETGSEGPSGGVEVLRSSKALPLDVEAQRPLFIAIQVLFEFVSGLPADSLAQPAAGSAEGDGSDAGAVSLQQQQLQQILLPPLLQQVLPVLQHHLGSLQSHLAALTAEAGGVLARVNHHQQHVRSRSPAGQHQQQRHWDSLEHGLGEAGAAGNSDVDSAGTTGPELVPFEAFDESLAGADMLLEGLESGSGSDNSAAEEPAGQERHTAGQAGLLAGLSAEGELESALPELVPFDGFDEGLAGAGEMLEGGSGAGGGFFGSLGGGSDGGLDDDEGLFGGALEADDESGDGAVDQHGEAGDSSMHTAGAAAAQDEGSATTAAAADAQAARLAQQLTAAGVAAAVAMLQQQRLAGLRQVEGSCVWQQQVWLRHLAAFEWLWGDFLPQGPRGTAGVAHDSLRQLSMRQTQLHRAAAAALGLQVPASSSSSGGGSGVSPSSIHADGVVSTGVYAVQPGAAYQQFCRELLPQLPSRPGSSHGSHNGSSDSIDPQQQQEQQRMPTSVELLQSWQVLCEQQASVADGLTAWRAASAAAAAAVGEVLLLPAGGGGVVAALQVTDPTVCQKMLSGHVARAGHWLSAAAGLVNSLSQQAEASLQLEYSRRGRLWAPGMPEGVDAFQGNASLLHQLAAAATALGDAQAQVAGAEALLAASQAAAAQAQLTIDEAAAEAAAAEQQLVLKTPAAIARAQGMLPVLEPMVVAAEAALPYVTDGLGTTLRALVTLVERNSAARDLAPVVKAVCLQHGRCLRVLQRLHGIGAACVAGMSSVVAGMQQWQLQQEGDVEQQEAEAVLVSVSPARDAQLLQLLLTSLQPALSGVREELSELGQAHVLFTHLTERLDSLAGAAETVAAAITSDHAMQMPAAGQRHFMPAAAGSAGSSSTGRKQRAEARQRAFAAAALARCTARLTGQRYSTAKAAAEGAEAAGAPATSAASKQAQSGASSSRSVVDEVAALVSAATSVDKLSRMYEGWAAWL